jgi:hypothetical protein
VKPKIYATKTVAKVAKVLADAPVLPPQFISHEDTINELTERIQELHYVKNYDARQVVQLLKQNGIRTTLREVRSLLVNTPKKQGRKSAKKDV